MRSVALHCLVLLAPLPFTTTLDVLSPGRPQYVQSPLFNRFIGQQENLDRVNLTATLAYEQLGECCDSRRAEVNGKIVVVINNADFVHSFHSERDAARCLETRGAIAVIRSMYNIMVPGFSVNFNQHVHNTVTIPVVTTVHEDFAWYTSLARDGERVVVTLTVDNNPWLDMWDSALFIVLFRVVVPCLNVIALVIALQGVRLHILRITHHPHFPRFTIMLLGCVIEAATSLVRAVYFAYGPAFSSPSIPYNWHIFLMGGTLPWEVASCLLGVILFLNWGALGLWSARTLACVRVLLWSAIVTLIFAQFSLSGLQTYGNLDTTVLLALNAITMVVVACITSVLFLLAGFKFVKRLRTKVGQLSRVTIERSRQIRRAVQWIMASAIAQMLTIAGGVICMQQSILLTPRGWAIGLGVVYGGCGLSAIAHASAFRPVLPRRLSATPLLDEQQQLAFGDSAAC